MALTKGKIKINDIEYGNGKKTSATLYKYIPASTSETSNE